MSNGTQIVSRPVLVPRRLGGPDAFYYQAVRGPSPIPVSLIERDAHGHTLRVLKLQRIVGCSKHPLKYLPGGKRTLVRGQTPQGPAFSIVGERYRLFGRIHAQLKLKTGEGLVSSDEGEEEDLDRRSKRIVRRACKAHDAAGLGNLRRLPSARILDLLWPAQAAARHGAREGRRQARSSAPCRIPGSLHAGGVFVYLASSRSTRRDRRALAERQGRHERKSQPRGERRARNLRRGIRRVRSAAGCGFSETGETSRIVLKTDALRLSASLRFSDLPRRSIPRPVPQSWPASAVAYSNPVCGSARPQPTGRDSSSAKSIACW